MGSTRYLCNLQGNKPSPRSEKPKIYPAPRERVGRGIKPLPIKELRKQFEQHSHIKTTPNMLNKSYYRSDFLQSRWEGFLLHARLNGLVIE